MARAGALRVADYSEIVNKKSTEWFISVLFFLCLFQLTSTHFNLFSWLSSFSSKALNSASLAFS